MGERFKKDEAIIYLVNLIANADGEISQAEIEKIFSDPTFRKVCKKIDTDVFRQKTKKLGKDDAISTLKKLVYDTRVEALALVLLAVAADDKVSDEERQLFTELCAELDVQESISFEKFKRLSAGNQKVKSDGEALSSKSTKNNDYKPEKSNDVNNYDEADVILTRKKAKTKNLIRKIWGVILGTIFTVVFLKYFIGWGEEKWKIIDYIVAGIFALIVLPCLLKTTKPIICEDCDSDQGYTREEEVLTSTYKHATKSGKPDLRHKDNPKTNKILVTETCVNPSCRKINRYKRTVTV